MCWVCDLAPSGVSQQANADEAHISQEICLRGYTSSTAFARDVQASAQRDDTENKKLPDQNRGVCY
jgi:hypothetical protein